MRRAAFLAAVLAFVGCYPPPGGPEPVKLRIDPLLPTPLLDGARAACTARALYQDAAAPVAQQDRETRTDYARLWEKVPAGRPAWATDSYQAAYDAAQDAARDLTVDRAALDAAARVSAQPQSAADYAEIALAHERAFAAAAAGKDRSRRRAAETLRRMAASQPDLEALYQSEFQTRYRSGTCGGAAPAAHLTSAPTAQALPLLSTPLVRPSRAACASAALSERAAGEWRFVYARQIGKPIDLPAGPPATGIAWTDWRPARDFADLAALHTAAFALGTAPATDRERRRAENRVRKSARAHPDLETLYQQAFDREYRSGACAALK